MQFTFDVDSLISSELICSSFPYNAEVYGTNAYTCWAWCSHFNLLSWICYKGLIYSVVLTVVFFVGITSKIVY